MSASKNKILRVSFEAGDSPLNFLTHQLIMTSTPDTNAIRSDNSDMPEDVILEILWRLPAKSLFRFKCVCKPWSAVIASRYFVKEYYGHGSNEELLLVGWSQVYGWNVHTFEESALHLQFPNKLRRVMGAVNGIFLVVVGSNLVTLALWNPATKELKPLPQQPDHIISEQYLHGGVNIIGFGLDPLSGHFKVVSIWDLWDDDARDLGRRLVFVYNSGTDSWRNVASFKSSYFVRDTDSLRTYCNGVYYWIYQNITGSGILAFDMRTDKFEEIKVPDCVKSTIVCITTYGDDSIALVTISKLGNINNNTFEVWVMENKGIRSWNRVAVVSPLQDMGWPVCLWKNNELLFKSKKIGFTLYNIRTRKIRRSGAPLKQGTSELNCVVSYKESLVSIK